MYSDCITAKVARANCKETTCGSLRLRLHKPHVAISRPHALTPQSSVAVTHYILTATHFTYPEGMETWVEFACPGNRTRALSLERRWPNPFGHTDRQCWMLERRRTSVSTSTMEPLPLSRFMPPNTGCPSSHWPRWYTCDGITWLCRDQPQWMYNYLLLIKSRQA